MTSAGIEIDPLQYRRVLGHFPTGVVGITSIGPDGEPVGMAVGSFTSVSLDPPLVAFLPDKNSSTFPKIRDAGFFCVNVLAATQELVCRAFASKGGDKFRGLQWTAAGSGAPLLAGSVAWMDCDIESIYEAGDHYIVVGRVRELEVAEVSLPLLFFQGGYGRFAPLSFAAASEPDLVEQLRLVDLARPQMEDIAAQTGVECLAVAVVQRDMVIVASTGLVDGDVAPTRVGQRIPFTPPLGAAFVAWSEDATQPWLARLGTDVPEDELDHYRAMLSRVRSRGWSMGLGGSTYREFEASLAATFVDSFTPEQGRAVQQAVDKLGGEYEPDDLQPGHEYPIRNINVPVFGPDGNVVLLLSLYRLSAVTSYEQILEYRDVLFAAASAISARIGRQ